MAMAHGVKVGAHPGYPDKENFGRKPFPMEINQLKKSLFKQIERVKREVEKQGGSLHHVKPHGALYNELKTDREKAAVITEIMNKIGMEVSLFVPPDSVVKELAENTLKKIKVEGFADRRYNADFSLKSRSSADAVLDRKEAVLKQVLDMALFNGIKLEDGTLLKQKFDTICIHSDTPGSVEILTYLNEQLPLNNVHIRA